MVAFASSLDQAGPLARTRARLRDHARARWPATTRRIRPASTAPVPDYEAAIGASIKGLTIGIPREYRLDGMNPEIEALWRRGADWLRAAGAKVVDVSLPNTRHALPAYYIVAPAEASSNLARYDGVRYGLREPGGDIVELYENTRAKGFGAEVRRRLMIGTYVLSAGYYDAYYVRAQKIRTLIKRDFETAFADGVDAILTPATPSPAFGIGEMGSADPVEMYLNDVFTVTVNMAGLPGLVAAAGKSAEGLPLGLQLIGRPFDEETLFSLGHAIEEAAGRAPFPEPWWEDEAAARRADQLLGAKTTPLTLHTNTHYFSTPFERNGKRTMSAASSSKYQPLTLHLRAQRSAPRADELCRDRARARNEAAALGELASRLVEQQPRPTTS